MRARRPDVVDDEIVAVTRAVLPLALSLCRSREEAEDVLAEAVGCCLDRWRSGRIDHPRAYLRAAVVNEVRQRHRRRGRLRLTPLFHDDGDQLASPAADTDRIDDELTVRAELRKLPERQRLAVSLRYLEDLPYEAIADLMGVAVGTAKSQVSRGVARLGATLAESRTQEACDG
ncbi:MAG: sigma-70 family RNA polymerase sigma factor [Actinobacteria bacterium]|nr:sigma-70 family RNA polymerase sigma factor [Actinomycetota bacterium]